VPVGGVLEGLLKGERQPMFLAIDTITEALAEGRLLGNGAGGGTFVSAGLCLGRLQLRLGRFVATFCRGGFSNGSRSTHD
jgi:hypothetical protein